MLFLQGKNDQSLVAIKSGRKWRNLLGRLKLLPQFLITASRLFVDFTSMVERPSVDFLRREVR